MSHFPTLIPAFTANIVLERPSSVGSVARGAPLSIVPFTANSGFMRSEPDYPVKLDAVVLHGSDFIRQDPSGKHVRLDVSSSLKDQNSGAIVAFKYTGIINITNEVAAVFGGTPDAKTTSFGDAFSHAVFETGSEELKGLELKVFVGSGRFIIEGDKTTVEYKISEVAGS